MTEPFFSGSRTRSHRGRRHYIERLGFRYFISRRATSPFIECRKDGEWPIASVPVFPADQAWSLQSFAYRDQCADRLGTLAHR